METPNSNTNKALWKIKEFIKPNIPKVLILAKSLIIRWPAIILAAKRTAKVNGRIKCLIVSIKTIKGAKYRGLPSGTRWAELCLKFLNHPIKKKESQSERPNPKVTTGWAVKVNTKGNKPIKLLRNK